jgi:hypothetical protein
VSGRGTPGNPANSPGAEVYARPHTAALTAGRIATIVALGDQQREQVTEVCARLWAEAAASERERIRQLLLGGDPVVIEARFREFVDDEEAADCAGIVADLLREDSP